MSVFSTNYTKRHLKSNNIAVSVKDIEIRLMTFPEKNDQALNVYILKNVLSQFKLPFKLPGHCL